jgi:hypothetical protein
MLFIGIFIGFVVWNNPYYLDYKFIMILLLVLLPTWGGALYLLVEYHVINNNTKLKINNTEKLLLYNSKLIKRKIHFNDIAYIHKHKGITSAFFGYFHFFVLAQENGEKLIITSLMTRDLNISGTNTQIFEHIFPSINLLEADL